MCTRTSSGGLKLHPLLTLVKYKRRAGFAACVWRRSFRERPVAAGRSPVPELARDESQLRALLRAQPLHLGKILVGQR